MQGPAKKMLPRFRDFFCLPLLTTSAWPCLIKTIYLPDPTSLLLILTGLKLFIFIRSSHILEIRTVLMYSFPHPAGYATRPMTKSIPAKDCTEPQTVKTEQQMQRRQQMVSSANRSVITYRKVLYVSGYLGYNMQVMSIYDISMVYNSNMLVHIKCAMS